MPTIMRKNIFIIIAFSFIFLFSQKESKGQLTLSGQQQISLGAGTYQYIPQWYGSDGATFCGSYTYYIVGGYIDYQGNQYFDGYNDCTPGYSTMADMLINVVWTDSVGELYLYLDNGYWTSISVTSVAPLTGGYVTPSTQQIASGGQPQTITTYGQSGGCAGGGSFSYWWQQSSDAVNWQFIPGAYSTSYTPGTQTTTKYYRAYVTENCSGEWNFSEVATVEVNQTPSATISPSSQNINVGGTATTLTSSASGGNGSYSYQWQSSPNNSTWTNVGTSSSYSPGSPSSTMWYRLQVTSNSQTATSNTAVVNVCPPVPESIIGKTVCVKGSTLQLANNVSGGTWSSTNSSIAKVDANGVVTGQSEGTATIRYIITSACRVDTVQLGITVVPFTDISQGLGKGINDVPKYDTISLTQGVVKTLSFQQDTLYSSAHTIKNVLAFRIVEETTKYIPGDFSATAVLKVEYGHSSADVYQIDSIKLQVDYSKNEGLKYNALNYFSFQNAEFTRITVIRVEAPTTVNGVSFDTKQVLLLTNLLAATRYYKLADNKKPTLFFSEPIPSSTVPDELQAHWSFPLHTQHNGVQLEWAWLENEMNNSYFVNGSLDTLLLFKSSSTRIDLPTSSSAGNYQIPLLYDGAGKLFVRIRGVNNMPGGSLSEGMWSGVQTFSFDGHSTNLNWQSTTTFAEEGKRKTVMQYYDGSLRPRQTVTKDNSTGQTVVAETFYDKQGRPAVQILPAPGINNIIAYNQNLNKFNTQPDNSDPADYFDFTTTSLGNYNTHALSENSGTAKYYSTQNPDANTGYHKNIPIANGWAFTQTRYTPDATGRIMRQSGVGDSLRMGGGHETKYFYGTASQEELDALFGTEVGNYTHYFKNMVQDANGQMSVSYVDMQGRTIATALASDAPYNTQALNVSDTNQYKNQAGKILTRNLLDKGSNVLKGQLGEGQTGKIESINTVLVPFQVNHSFNYTLAKKTLILPKCGGGTVSYDCKFDLQISITDESGDASPVVYNYIGIDNINFNQTILLNAGSYSVRKTLTINPDSLAQFIALYNTVGVGICKTQQQLIDSIYAQDSTGCGVSNTTLSSTSCMTSLGSYSSYLTSYATSLGKTVGQLTTVQLNDIRVQYVADSAFCASLNENASGTLKAIRNQMLRDMVPYSGQYARDTATVTIAKKYNIFATGGSTPYTQSFYKYPKTANLVTDVYYDAFGNVDSSVLSSRLQTMTQSEFQQEFKESWANSLLPYHPEFKKLKFAEDSLRNAFNFIDSIQNLSTAFNPINSDPFFTIPSRSADKDSITKYSNVAWTGMGGFSIWQIAYADAFGCKTLLDPNQRSTCYSNMPKVFTTTGTSVNTGSGTVTLSASIQAQAWSLYKAMYGQVRGDLVNRYINVRPGTTDTSDNRTLINYGFRLYFPYNYVQAAQNNQWNSWYPGANNGAPSSVNLADSVKNYSNRCESYINTWRLALLDCPALAEKDSAAREAILNSITGKMLQVCKNGTDAANPYGSSTVAPAHSGATYTSFEQAVNAVLDSAGISRTQFCNPYTIEWPKPWGKNPQITQQYVSSLDTCNCSQWSKLSNEIWNADYNINSFTSVNEYLLSKYQDTLTPVLYNTLQQCGQPYLYNCRDSVIGYYDHTIYITDTIQLCDTLQYRPLATAVPLPRFMQCGFDSSSYKCYTCTDFVKLDSSFYLLFGKHPVFNGTVPDTMFVWNDLFAKYVNFKTGLRHNWQYYAEKFQGACSIGGITSSGGTVSICLERKTLNDTTGFSTTITQCQLTKNRSTLKGTLLYEYNQEKLLSNFKAAYLNASIGVTETFTVTDTIKEYHYTLYYYDQAGNLVKTVPPKGVRPDYSNTFLNAVKTQRAIMEAGPGWTPVVPQHSFVTRYNYNSLNQVVLQKTPDASVSKFWYDRLGRLSVSQNSKQSASGNTYSYTFYDVFGRITEVGQIESENAITDAIAKNESNFANWMSAFVSRTQMTKTVYDLEYDGFVNTALTPPIKQRNLRNRVSYSFILNDFGDDYAASATYYSYDIHGNVDTLLQDFGNPDGIMTAMNETQRFKKIVYDYDLVSGKVNQVSYQPGQIDAYYHRYVYDAENRLTDVYSGRDSVMLFFFPEREAKYSYYKHGPLANTTLGQLQVQKQDYVYTLQGWLKAVNPVMGGTLTNGTDTTEAYPITQDAYGFSLHYFKNDYKAIGFTPQSTNVLGSLGSNAAPLFNGNIAAMAVNIPKLGNTKLYNYHYDQLHRIKAMDVYNGLTPTAGTFVPISVNDYQERISYDPNGNILTYQRNGDAARLSMDNLSYYYKPNTNQLHKVTDAATDGTTAYNDIKQGQGDNNYQYDQIGNMVKDNAEGITAIDWNVYGKIRSITKSNGFIINYTYDAAGNRMTKQLSNGQREYYVRDAAGNVLSVYTSGHNNINNGDVSQSEVHLYGSSRLGINRINVDVEYPDQNNFVVLSGGFGKGIKSNLVRGEKFFELSNHLGNVLTTISDKRIANDNNSNGIIDFYTADIASANDYYPFGMVMPGRKYVAPSTGSGGYRYGFNGKENDNEVKSEGNQQDYGMRIYDPRLGRFLSVDPITKDYPELTPYQFASNRPIDGIDLDGLEFAEYGYPHSRIQERYRNAKTPEELERIRKQDRRGMLIAGGMLGAGFLGAGVLTYGTITITTTLRIVTSPQLSTAVTSAATVVGKYGPDAGNFVYGIVTGDAMEPIPTNTGSQSADVGVAFRNLFKAPVEISGLFKKAGAVSAVLIKGTNSSKVAVIGQGMDKVKMIASGVKNPEIFKPSEEALKQWNKLLADNPGKNLSDDVVKGTKIFKENQTWINNVKKEGYDILDTGGGSTSTFYNMEKQVVYGSGKK